MDALIGEARAGPAARSEVVAVGPRAMPDKLRALKREVPPLDPFWVIVCMIALFVAAVIGILRSLVRRRRIDRRMLSARVLERGFTEEERELIHAIADWRAQGDACELVPRLRRYTAALDAFLEGELPVDEEEREALVRLLSAMRHKLGFENLPDYRLIPSTREIPPGTEVSLRRNAGRRGEFHPFSVYMVDDLELRVRPVTRTDGGMVLDDPPVLAEGDPVEAAFVHGGRRRCRFLTRVAGAPEGEGPMLPLEHARVRSVTLERGRRSDLELDATLRVAGETREVRVVEMTPRYAFLGTPLDRAVRRGELTLLLPDQEGECDIPVERSEADPGDRLTYVDPEEAVRQRILRFVTERTPARAPA